MRKEEVLINIQSEFQELMYIHSQGKKSTKYNFKVMNDEMFENCLEQQEAFVEEIIDEKEASLFDLFRWYKNNQDEETYLPKSRILSFLFGIDMFVKNHCMTICKAIESKSNNEHFLDEYTTRWQSFTSLIEIFETEFSFVEILVNNIYEHDDFRKEISEAKINTPEFSFLRLMCRAWGKYVMKVLFEKFNDKVTSVLVNYQKKLLTLTEDFYECNIPVVESQILNTALHMVLDVSINEYSIKQIGSSTVPLSMFYPKLEDRIMRLTKPFLKALFLEASPDSF